MRLSVSPVGFIPDAAHSSNNLPEKKGTQSESELSRNNHVHRFFLHRLQLSRPHSRFSMLSTLTDAPVASFTTRPLRATQHATGLMVKVARFSHREADFHHIGSLTEHTIE